MAFLIAVRDDHRLFLRLGRGQRQVFTRMLVHSVRVSRLVSLSCYDMISRWARQETRPSLATSFGFTYRAALSRSQTLKSEEAAGGISLREWMQPERVLRPKHALAEPESALDCGMAVARVVGGQERRVSYAPNVIDN